MATRRTFHWSQMDDELSSLWKSRGCTWDDALRRFVTADADPPVSLRLPAVLPLPNPTESAVTYLERLPSRLGLQVVLLIQAGASALGLWRDDELVAHRVIRKYVVRGNGKAQGTHLKTKGKSRYGSRLRLQGAKSQLEETNQLLVDWVEDEGGPDRVFVSCPVRTASDLWRSRPAPPFDRDDTTRIPYHVHPPRFEELLRIRRLLERGSVESEETS